MKLLALAAIAVLLALWLFRRAFPHDGFEPLPNVDWTSESICDCGLYATGYRESWAVRHTASCVYTKARTT